MRRKFLIVCLLALGLILTMTLSVGAQGKTTLVVMIRGLDNPYHANYAVGARELGKKLGLPVDVLSSEGNSQKQFADLRAEIATACRVIPSRLGAVSHEHAWPVPSSRGMAVS